MLTGFMLPACCNKHTSRHSFGKNGSSVEGIASWADDASAVNCLFSRGWLFIVTHWGGLICRQQGVTSVYKYFHDIFLWADCVVTSTCSSCNCQHLQLEVHTEKCFFDNNLHLHHQVCCPIYVIMLNIFYFVNSTLQRTPPTLLSEMASLWCCHS